MTFDMPFEEFEAKYIRPAMELAFHDAEKRFGERLAAEYAACMQMDEKAFSEAIRK